MSECYVIAKLKEGEKIHSVSENLKPVKGIIFTIDPSKPVFSFSVYTEQALGNSACRAKTES